MITRLAERDRHEPGYGLFPLPGRGHLHEDHGGLQRSFNAQLQPFLAFVVGGGLGLYGTLGARHPSRAIFWASFACPFATFYAITSFLHGDQGDMFIVLLVAAIAYGFTTAAILIPAIYEFDETTGRTTE